MPKPNCPFDVTGFSLTSLPGVVIGKNTAIAWGLTTSYVDVQDLFIEQVEGDTVREGDAFVPLAVRTEEIRVRGEDQPRTIRIRSSRHGPLLSDVDVVFSGWSGPGSGTARAPYAVALSWVASTPGRTMDCRPRDRIRRATSPVPRGGRAAQRARRRTWCTPTPQATSATSCRARCRNGAAGTGVRRRRAGTPATTGEGLIPFAELPYAYNPPGGFLVAANQPVIGRQYPVPARLGVLLRLAQPGDRRPAAGRADR